MGHGPDETSLLVLHDDPNFTLAPSSGLHSWLRLRKLKMLLVLALVFLGSQYVFTVIYQQPCYQPQFSPLCNTIKSINPSSTQLQHSLLTNAPLLIATETSRTNTKAVKSSVIFVPKPCPTIPPNLEGPYKLNTTFPDLAEIEKALRPTVMKGGLGHPTCIARESVALVIPYRLRESQLHIFLANLHPFLQRQQLEYGIFVIEQFGTSSFNRAMLMNVGFQEALAVKNFTCFIFHDVDLLPEDDRNLYSCPEQPRHMSVAVDILNYKLPYAEIFGGVSAMRREHVELVNGFSNEFWGWGGEDDDMANRIQFHGLHIVRYPANIARYKMLSHVEAKKNDNRFENLAHGKSRFHTDGLNSLQYKVHKRELRPLYTWILAELTDANHSTIKKKI